MTRMVEGGPEEGGEKGIKKEREWGWCHKDTVPDILPTKPEIKVKHRNDQDADFLTLAHIKNVLFLLF